MTYNPERIIRLVTSLTSRGRQNIKQEAENVSDCSAKLVSQSQTDRQSQTDSQTDRLTDFQVTRWCTESNMVSTSFNSSLG